MEKKFHSGDKVKITSKDVLQVNQKPLNNLEGTVIELNDTPNSTYVLLQDYPSMGPIEVSESELSHMANH